MTYLGLTLGWVCFNQKPKHRNLKALPHIPSRRPNDHIDMAFGIPLVLESGALEAGCRILVFMRSWGPYLHSNPECTAFIPLVLGPVLGCSVDLGGAVRTPTTPMLHPVTANSFLLIYIYTYIHMAANQKTLAL